MQKYVKAKGDDTLRGWRRSVGREDLVKLRRQLVRDWTRAGTMGLARRECILENFQSGWR